MMLRRPPQSCHSDGQPPPIDDRPSYANSNTSNESFHFLNREFMDNDITNEHSGGVGKPRNRVDIPTQRESSREKRPERLSFERKLESYYEELEKKFGELKELLLCQEEELLLKGREIQRTLHL